MFTENTNIELSIGTEVVGKWLRSNGFFEIENKDVDEKHYAAYVEAGGNKGRILIMVKILKSNRRSIFTSDDEIEVINKAVENQMEPWTAVVRLDKDNHFQSIEWRDLSKV